MAGTYTYYLQAYGTFKRQYLEYKHLQHTTMKNFTSNENLLMSQDVQANIKYTPLDYLSKIINNNGH